MSSASSINQVITLPAIFYRSGLFRVKGACFKFSGLGCNVTVFILYQAGLVDWFTPTAHVLQ